MSYEIRVHMHEIQFVEPGPHKGPAPCRAIFYGPNREANARKFAHVDELVEALTRFVRWADKLDHDASGTLAQGRAVLAKIRGDAE